MDFYEKFKSLCDQVGKSPSAVAIELGMNKAAASNWKRRISSPSPENTKKLADYFGVPLTYFEDDPIDNKNLFAMIDAHEKALLSAFRDLNTFEQAEVLVFVKKLRNNEDSKK